MLPSAARLNALRSRPQVAGGGLRWRRAAVPSPFVHGRARSAARLSVRATASATGGETAASSRPHQRPVRVRFGCCTSSTTLTAAPQAARPGRLPPAAAPARCSPNRQARPRRRPSRPPGPRFPKPRPAPAFCPHPPPSESTDLDIEAQHDPWDLGVYVYGPSTALHVGFQGPGWRLLPDRDTGYAETLDFCRWRPGGCLTCRAACSP
jgi:hypothetical protein